MNILVVDHSKVSRALWHHMVLKAGHEPIMVSTGAEGIKILETEKVDMVCVSLTLPDTSGIEFCRLARKLGRNSRVPLILLTSTEEKHVRAEAFAAGATDIYPKTDIELLFNQATRFLKEGNRSITGKVLYVEDSAVVAHVMLRIFKGLGLQVDHFKSATDAYEAFKESAYDLVVSDILVEGQMSGIGLVSRIRETHPDKTKMPILAVSGMNEPTRRVELFRLGINDFISKPVVEEEVVARASNLISNKQLFDQVQAQRRHLYELAMVDQLTGLYNRNALAEFGRKAFSEVNRHDFPLSMVLIDIDKFKNINDTRGHLTGDEVLAAIGEMIRKSCRKEDFPVRCGGEEIMVILPHCKLDDAARRAESLRVAIEELHPLGVQMTASLGVTARPLGREVSIEDLFRIADRAMYQAKAEGRNKVVVLLMEGDEPNSGGKVRSLRTGTTRS